MRRGTRSCSNQRQPSKRGPTPWSLSWGRTQHTIAVSVKKRIVILQDTLLSHPWLRFSVFVALFITSHPWFFTFFNPWLFTQPCFFSFSHPWFSLFPTLGHKCYSSLGFPLYHPCLLFIPWVSLLPTPGCYSALGFYSVGESKVLPRTRTWTDGNTELM